MSTSTQAQKTILKNLTLVPIKLVDPIPRKDDFTSLESTVTSPLQRFLSQVSTTFTSGAIDSSIDPHARSTHALNRPAHSIVPR